MVTLFLDENDIPTLTAFSGNIDADSLKPHIFTAQTNDIKRILGVTLYDKMLADYISGDLDGIYQTIYDDYLVPMEVYFACMYYMTFGGTKTTNNGVIKISFGNGVAISESETNRLIGVYRQLGNNNELFFYDYIKLNPVIEYTRSIAEQNNNNPVIPWY
jgi:hypothetical protein